MIQLLVDESYAFDYLSILNIKYDMDVKNIQKKENFLKCLEFIKNQFSDKALFDLIFSSDEYKECYQANVLTFEAVDKAKTDKVPASHVDSCNYKRCIAKQELQKKFFNNDTTEIKIGYEIYKKDL
jgi:hypothetical protein